MAEDGRFSGKGEGSAGEGCGDSRTALLEAALHCFAQRGFDGTSIRDIAAAAGRNSSLISYHFSSKEGSTKRSSARFWKSAERPWAAPPRGWRPGTVRRLWSG